MQLPLILKDTNYKLKQFSEELVRELEEKIIVKANKKGVDEYFVECLIRKKEIKLTPEEVVRQLYIAKLITEYGYSKEQIDVEAGVQMGRAGEHEKRADIVVYEDLHNFPIPLVDKTIQEQISVLIAERFTLRRESERLLG